MTSRGIRVPCEATFPQISRPAVAGVHYPFGSANGAKIRAVVKDSEADVTWLRDVAPFGGLY